MNRLYFAFLPHRHNVYIFPKNHILPSTPLFFQNDIFYALNMRLFFLHFPPFCSFCLLFPSFLSPYIIFFPASSKNYIFPMVKWKIYTYIPVFFFIVQIILWSILKVTVAILQMFHNINRKK